MWSEERRLPVLLPSLGLSVALLAACASQVEVDADFPAPLIEPLPVSVGVLMDESLTDYEHFEEIPDQITWTIRLGNANKLMLEQLLGSMFATTSPVMALPTPEAQSPFDGVIKPELEKFEFEVPVRGRDNFAEVWMQYRLKLYEPDGDLIADWPVSGYGKSEIMGSNREGSLNQVAIVAMREAGAAIVTQFAAQPQVEYWLQERQNRLSTASSDYLISSEESILTTPVGTNDD
ncbi:MAG TPA: hypothetical protein VLD39_02335 [Gammaproteobacteria bacterium]|nr:hypothetical protein [Gammaproteobacteria bacterium]